MNITREQFQKAIETGIAAAERGETKAAAGALCEHGRTATRATHRVFNDVFGNDCPYAAVGLYATCGGSPDWGFIDGFDLVLDGLGARAGSVVEIVG